MVLKTKILKGMCESELQFHMDGRERNKLKKPLGRGMDVFCNNMLEHISPQL